jgi:transposase
VASDWDDRLAAWRDELELLAQLDDTPWVSLAIAEAEAGVSRSALRAWYRNGDIASRLVDGPHGPQRLVPLQAVLDRAAKSARIQRRAEREVSLEAQLTLLRHRVDQLELRLAALERPSEDGLERRRRAVPTGQ